MNSIREEFDTREEAVKFLDKYNIIKFTPLKGYKLMAFSLFTDLCDHHTTQF